MYSNVLFGEDLEGEVHEIKVPIMRDILFEYEQSIKKEQDMEMFTGNITPLMEPKATLTITKVIPRSGEYEGSYDVHYNITNSEGARLAAFRFMFGEDLKNGWHAVNRAINEILEVRRLSRSEVDVVRVPGYDDALKGVPMLEPVDEVAPDPLLPKIIYSLSHAMNGRWYYGPCFDDFFLALDEADRTAIEHGVEIVISRNDTEVAIVNVEGEVTMLS